MEARMTNPPYKPILDTATDTKHFPKDFTSMKLSPQDACSLSDSCDAAGWKDFSYQKSNEHQNPTGIYGTSGSK
jgi:hypothetical protein